MEMTERGRGLLRLLRGLTGEDAYEKYLAHHDAVHGDDPDAPEPMSERSFWRDRTDRLDRNPQGRCC